MPVDRMDDLVTGYLRYRRKHFGVLVQQAWTMIAFKVVITAGLLDPGHGAGGEPRRSRWASSWRRSW